MSVVMKRSCNSSIKVENDKITFNSFVLTIDKKRYKEFKIISDNVMISPDTPDRNARILEHILELGLVHYALVMSGEEEEEE